MLLLQFLSTEKLAMLKKTAIVLNMIMAFEYIKDCCGEERDKLLSISGMCVTRNKLKQGRLRLKYFGRLSIFKDHISLGDCGNTMTGC